MFSGLDTEEQPPAIDIRDDFESLINNLAESLSAKNLEQLRYYYKTKLGAHEGEQTSALVILAKLEEKGVYALNNISPLEKMMKKIDRCDVVSSLIDPFKEKHRDKLQGTFHKSISMPTTQQYCSPSTHRRASHTTSLSFSRHPHTSQHSYTSLLSHTSACSLASIPENPHHGAEPSLFVCGKFTHNFSTSQNSNTHTTNVEEEIHSSEKSHEQELPTQQHQIGDHPWPSSSQLSMNNRSVHAVLGEKYSASVESTQFQFDNPPAEVRSKVKSTTDIMTVPLREQQEQHRSLTPSPVKSTQPIEGNSRESSIVLVPNNVASAFHLHDKEDAGRMVTTMGDQPTIGAAVSCHQENNVTLLASQRRLQEYKWHTQRPCNFKVKRKKICDAITNLSVSQCAKGAELVIPVGCSRSHGLKISMYIYPFGIDTNDKHLTVKACCVFEPKHQKCRELIENCSCVVHINIVAFELPSKKEIGRSDSNSVQLHTNSDGCVCNVLPIKLVPHHEVIYKSRDVKNIQFEVTAMLTCVELVHVDGEESGFLLVVSTGG